MQANAREVRARILTLLSGAHAPIQDPSGADALPTDRDDSPDGYVLETATFSQLLENFVHLEFSEEEALSHWKAILSNYDELASSLGRAPSVHMAIVDYFTAKKRILDSPLLVEVHVFRQTERLAMVDALTGIFNRRYMDIILKKEYNRCERYAKALSVCILDIDNFKAVNDTRGHQYGDLVLKEIASLIKESIREEDVACRYGGEEFLVVLPETDLDGALILAKRVRDNLKNSAFFKTNGVTFSAGVATFPQSASDMTSLIMAADRALYQAKFTGKDKIVSAPPERRRFDRYIEAWKLSIFADGSTSPINDVITQNISVGGTQFECGVRYPVDTSLTLAFACDEREVSDIEARARITWVKKNGKSYLYGVSFLEPHEELEQRLCVPYSEKSGVS